MKGKLSTAGLMKTYRRRQVVNGISLHMDRGEVVGLLGPNGAGKTTLFHMVLGLVRPDRGQVLLDGNDISDLPMYRRARLGIGYLPQESSVFRKMSVADNLRAVLQMRGLGSADVAQRTETLLDEFQIAHLATSRADTLSGGERRRLEIARALTVDPSFILLDEPFAGIDPKSRSDIQAIIGHLRERDIGVLITDHNVRETLQITDRAYIINEGAILESGSPQELTANIHVRRIYLGENFTLR
ncbi:MAG: LPS export ABC transporter ATP-binding protein [Acidobacteria bacterium]|nr:LPS export ABC transporter ATP-binding protein [Acidobacteriota bacterium]